MSLIAKGVYNIACSVFNAVVHVLLRDFTNYYWYNDYEAGPQDNSAQIEMVSNQNEEVKPSESGICGLESESLANESFCTALIVEDLAANVFDETNNIEENCMIQSCDVTIQNDALVNGDDNNTMKTLENESSQCVHHGFQNKGENYNCLASPKEENFTWAEMRNVSQNIVDGNLKQVSLNIPENGFSGHNFENMPGERESAVKDPIEDKLNYPLTNVDEVARTNETLNTYEGTAKKINTGEIEPTLRDCTQISENIFIGDSKKSPPESQYDGKSDISSECELGIRNFQIQNIIDTLQKVEHPEASNQNKPDFKKNPKKSKVSRYIGTTPVAEKEVEELKKINSSSTVVLEPASAGIGNLQLQPVTYNEITNTQSLLMEIQEIPELETNVALGKFSGVGDNLPEISKYPAEMSDMGSVCSTDSWDSWFGRFLSHMRPRTPVKKQTSFTETSNVAEEEVTEEDLCDCVNSHRCLINVDSDDEVVEDLLSAEQLGSVETGSVSDWLYRVNPPNPLLGSMVKLNEAVMCVTTNHEYNIQINSESSDEEIAKRFFIEQWLDSTETYYTNLYSKLIGSGDLI